MVLSIERRAARWGDRTAVVDHTADERHSYADLAERTMAAADRLAALGVGEGDAVAVLSRNRLELPALLFACYRLGAVFAPLSHRLTPATVGDPYRAVDPAFVLFEAAQRDLVRGMPDDETCTFEEFAAVERTGHTPVEREPESPLCYLGREPPDAPEPVVVPTRQVEWNCITAAAGWGLGRHDVAPILLPLSHAAGLLRLALPLLYVGGRIVLHRAFDPGVTLEAVQLYGATCLDGDEHELRELAEVEGFADADLASVEWAACGGRADRTVRDAYRTHGVPVSRVYGGAVAGPNALAVPPRREPVDPNDVGRPFPDCRARVVDGDGRPARTGETGRLELAGPVTATGYLGEEPFGEWVATGDRAHRDDDGDFHLVGA